MASYWVTHLDVLLVSVELRNIAENTVPQVEKGLASLKFVAEHYPELGIDPEKIIVTGTLGREPSSCQYSRSEI